MSALVLDAGAFLAVERADRWTIALLTSARRRGGELRTTGAVVGQVWRGGAGRQAELARLLRAVDVRAVDETLGRAVGSLLGRAGTSDVVDASVVLVAAPGDRIVTSDRGDLARLLAAGSAAVTLVDC